MCNAFSCIVTKNKKVYWKTGIDGHHDLIEKYNIPELVKTAPKNIDTNEQIAKYTNIAKIEIAPENDDYLNPDKWNFKIDEGIEPEWFTQQHEDVCYKAFMKWRKTVYAKIKLKEARNPIDPFKIEFKGKVTEKQIDLLKQWASVRASVRASVWDLVGASVGDSVGDSMYVYIGSLFRIKKFKCVDYKKLKIKAKDYPFQPCVDLWKQGLVPCTDGTKWCLFANVKGEVKVVWEGEL